MTGHCASSLQPALIMLHLPFFADKISVKSPHNEADTVQLSNLQPRGSP